jgi:hypothetical protein
MVWPALYVSQEFWVFWYLIIGTIFLETFTAKFVLNLSYSEAFWASLVGNLVSGLLGTFLMMYGMLFWHMIADNIVPHGTFDTRNWVMTFVLMCLGSVFIESLVVRVVVQQSLKKIFMAMLIGNFLSYSWIAYKMITKTDKDPDETQKERVQFLPVRRNFNLLNGSSMRLDTAFLFLSLDKKGDTLNVKKHLGYDLIVPFTKRDSGSFVFTLNPKDTLNGHRIGGTDEKHVKMKFQKMCDTVELILAQKNPKPDVGWKHSINTDTIRLIRIK